MAIFDSVTDEVQKAVKQMLSGSGEIKKAVESVASDLVTKATQAQKRQMDAVDKTIANYGRVHEQMKKDAETSRKVVEEATKQIAEHTALGKVISRALDEVQRGIDEQRKKAENARDKLEKTATEARDLAKRLADEKTRHDTLKKVVDDMLKYHPAVLARKIEALEKRCSQLETQLKTMKK